MNDEQAEMERSLRLGSGHQSRWYPVPINVWREVLSHIKYDGKQILLEEKVRSNIAYNLQYLEYLQQTVKELSLSAVLGAQTYKSYILVAIGIIESILYYLNVSTGRNEKRLYDILEMLEKNEIFGKGSSIYGDLHKYRKLRNKVHLYEHREELETDYTSFGDDEFEQMKKLLFELVSHPALGLPTDKLNSFEFIEN